LASRNVTLLQTGIPIHIIYSCLHVNVVVLLAKKKTDNKMGKKS
jgi:hypothetical protein